MYAVYENAAGIGATPVRLVLSTVEVSPPVQGVSIAPGPLLTPEVLDADGEIETPATYGPDIRLPTIISPGVYRDETAAETIARLGAEGRLPSWPWSRWVLLPDDHPAALVAASRLSVADWGDPSSVVIGPEIE